MDFRRLNEFLPTSKKEIDALGWTQADVIIFTGDAYVDHPAFGAAVIGRVLQAAGYKVALVPQPNWRDDLRDFKKLGVPRLFFGVTAGAMDSMVNRYTANKRLRSDDAYSADGRPDLRPNRAATVYCRILRQLFPDTPLVVGGIEVSLRRLTHYDFWDDELKPSAIYDTAADLIVYGAGEKPIREIADRLNAGENISDMHNVPQTVFSVHRESAKDFLDSDAIYLHSFEQCKSSKLKFGFNFKTAEIESNRIESARLLEDCGDHTTIVNPPFVADEAELDAAYDLPYTRMPHPRYAGKHIPAYEMIKHSITTHRGCFGGCSFCTISAHQGKFVISRSRESIMKEVDAVVDMPDFKGHISDLGGPSANMYRMKGRNPVACAACKKPSCIFPSICPNLDINHSALTEIYEAVRAHPKVKKLTIGSGIRYDLFLSEKGFRDESGERYFKTVMKHHVSGRLKVAPEHVAAHVLDSVRKPSFALFKKLKEQFDNINKSSGLRLQLIPYFVSGLPGCRERDMASLASELRKMRYKPEQVQSFTPTPMTLASVIFYTGIDPYTNEKVYVARDKVERTRQQEYFFR